MNDSSQRPAEDVQRVMEHYGDILYRVCFVLVKNSEDAADAVQDTMIKYLQKAQPFETEAHEKAWLITVASNRCRDLLRFRTRHPQVCLDEVYEYSSTPENAAVLEALMELPEKFSLALTLYYVEEYSINEIAQMLGRSASAVKMRLKKGRALLEEVYRKEYLSYEG